MKANSKAKCGIERTLEDWTRAYAEHDLAACLALVTPDADAAFIGTGADEERCSLSALRAGIRRDFAQTSKLRLAL